MCMGEYNLWLYFENIFFDMRRKISRHEAHPQIINDVSPVAI